MAVATEANAISIADSAAPLTIGKAECSLVFHVFVDEVEIFNRALSATEIEAIANGGTACKSKAITYTDTDTEPYANADTFSRQRFTSNCVQLPLQRHQPQHQTATFTPNADPRAEPDTDAYGDGNSSADRDTDTNAALSCANSAADQCRRVKHL